MRSVQLFTRSAALGPLIAMCAAAALSTPAPAQDPPPRPPAEAAALADAAERAPLFGRLDVLPVTLAADIEDLKRERDEEVERDGSLTFPGPDEQPMTVPVKLTTRGIFRLDKRNCNFPPLLLNLPRGQVGGTIFDGQNKLKVVTPCNDRRAEHERYVLREYLVYRTFNMLTPISFRVRLLRITLRDSAGESDDRTVYGFLIEDVDRLAERNLARESDWPRFHPRDMEARQATLVDLFQFMIGNTDWSAPYFHNVKMIKTAHPTYLVVPFDFDFAGAVHASYARPDPRFEIRNVRQRLYRGFCRDDFDYQPLVAHFNERRDAIYGMVRAFEPLEEKERDDLLEYYDGFYEVLNNEGRFRREIVNACRQVGA